jgi:hypothetical protein
LATAIIRIALRQILTRYRLAVVPGAEVGVHVESTMLVPTTGLPMQIHEMDGQFSASPMKGRIHELVEFDEAPAFAGHDAADAKVDVAPPRRPR